VEIRKVPLKNMEVDLDGIRSQIDSNTIMIVGSCPDFAFGNFENMPALAEIALDY